MRLEMVYFRVEASSRKNIDRKLSLGFKITFLRITL